MPLHSNVLVSAFATLGLDGSEREPESGIMPTPVDASTARLVATESVELVEELPAESFEELPAEAVEELSAEAVEELPADAAEEERPSRPIARIAIARVSAMAMPAAVDLRGVELALTGAPTAHVTIALADGTVLHEGLTGEDGLMAVRVQIPRGQVEVRAMIEVGSKHRTALVRVADEGPTQFSFR